MSMLHDITHSSALAHVLEFFNTQLFQVNIAGLPISTTWLEVLGFLTGVWCVWLAARRHALNFPVGIVNTSLFVVLFLGVGLYADMLLQFVYIALNAAGWYWWLRGGPERTQLGVRRVGWAQALVLVVMLGAGTWTIYELLSSHTNSTVPVWDALTTALSLVAQYMLGRKLLENWFVWITADLIYIPLYAYKGLYLTAALYIVFLGLCVYGVTDWRRQLTEGEAADVEVGPAGAAAAAVEA